MKEILKVENVIKYYGSDSVLTKALNGISLSVAEGEFVAIMGASGSGKSTLLNTIATIDRVSSGDITIDDKKVSDMTEDQLSLFRRDRLGFIFQDYNLLDTLTIEENIVMPLNLKRLGMAEIKKELERVATTLDIKEQLGKFPEELSGGQRQRAACARALVTNPSLILADEPTGALDSANSIKLMKTFMKMNQEFSSTILMVTHDAMVGSCAKRVLFLRDGKIWNELIKGEQSRKEFYTEILNVSAALGGEADVF